RRGERQPTPCRSGRESRGGTLARGGSWDAVDRGAASRASRVLPSRAAAGAACAQAPAAATRAAHRRLTPRPPLGGTLAPRRLRIRGPSAPADRADRDVRRCDYDDVVTTLEREGIAKFVASVNERSTSP